MNSGINTVTKAFALLVSAILICGTGSTLAFADEGSSLAAGSSTLSAQASNVKSAKKTTKKVAAFKYKKYSTKKQYGKITADYSFKKPVINGSSKVVKKINTALNKRYTASLPNKEYLLESAQRSGNDTRSAAYRNAETFFWNTTSKASYNKNGIVSFHYKTDWFAGGVHNSGNYGSTFSLKTGKELNVSQVISGNEAQVKKKIGQALAAKYNHPVSEQVAKVTSLKTSDIEFYLKNGNVVVCFDPYALSQGNAVLTVTLKGSYA